MQVQAHKRTILVIVAAVLLMGRHCLVIEQQTHHG